MHNPAAQAAQAIEEQLVAIPIGSQLLYGKLTVPLESSGLILFAQGSGSGLHNPRNHYVDRYVARLLNELNGIYLYSTGTAFDSIDALLEALEECVSALGRPATGAVPAARAAWERA